MDSWRKASSSSSSSLSLSLLSCLLLVIFSLLFYASYSAASGHPFAAPESSNKKVSLVLYYETLCPYCSNFIVNELIHLFDNNGLASIVDLKLVPYGNAKIGTNGTITCQWRALQRHYHPFIRFSLSSLLSSSDLQIHRNVVTTTTTTTTNPKSPFKNSSSQNSHSPSHQPAMASSRSFLTLSFFFFFLLTIFSVSRVSSHSDSDEKVSLGLYYETLCPYSANFIVNYLAKIFENGLIDIVDLNLVPFGNAKISSNNTIDCQHGPSECLLNTVEACAISVWPNLSEHFPFIYCVETLVYEHKYPQWIQCFEKLGLDPKPIFDCYDSGYGKELELQYAAETSTLQPPHTYVPWVVVDGQPLYEDYENFMSYVCKAYNGTAVPKACSELSLKAIPKERGSSINLVCYTEKTAGPTLSTRIKSAITSWIYQLSM